MMLQLVCASSLLLLANITNGAKLVLESDNKVIYPVATKKLNLRCSVKKGNWGLREHGSDTKNNSQELGATSVSSEELFEHLMSIVITEGKRQTIASVTGCDKPVIERAFEGVVTAVGNAENSTELEEMGHLTLTWDRPLLKDADNFTCEAFALNPDKASASLSVSLEITAVEPNLSDLLDYISSNDRQVELLKQNWTFLQETFNSVQANILQLQGKTNDFDTALAGLKSQNIQSGTFECRDVTIKFARPFDFPPKIFSSFIDLNFESNYAVQYTINYVSVNETHFTVRCTLGRYNQYINAKIEWIAIDV
uniref:H-type lectin domain-containing protein n=1 Tax=Biomphalaria glabrata TaxID=6526 RepID=A0A2C9L1T3_BIOGL